MKVDLQVKRIHGIVGSGVRGEMVVTAEMTVNQCKDAIIDLLNHDSEQAVFEWIKGAFPEWFEVKV